MNTDSSSLTQTDDLKILSDQLSEAHLPQDLYAKVSQMLARLQKASGSSQYSEELERTTHYIQWVVRLPWDKTTPDNLDLTKARQIMDQHHFGLEEVKERLLEFMAVLKLNQDKGVDHLTKAPILLLVGLVGTGKTTFAYSLAEAMGRNLARIPFGGMGAAKDLRGQSRLHLEAEPGYFIKSLAAVQSKNPIFLLDEIDRISDEAKSDVMGVLVEALDPEQNHHFVDHYLDYPFDLSQAIFIGTANGTSHIATAVLDRMEPISMPSYTDDEKIHIAKDYLLPRALEETALPPESITFHDSVWEQIVRPLGYDAGIRTLQRTIKGIIRKAAKEVVEGKITTLYLDDSNIKTYLPTYKTELI